MDLLLDRNGDLFITPSGDISLGNSVVQKIRMKLLWFEGEWRFDKEEGVPFFSFFFVKKPDLNMLESMVREKIFEVEEVVEVREVAVEVCAKKRMAFIRYVAATDSQVLKEEVMLKCQILE